MSIKAASQKQRLLQLLQTKGAPHSVYPLSFAQRRLWFLAQIDPANPSYHMLSSVRLTGLLQIPALRQSLAEIERRHASLRTRFSMEDGHPKQVVEKYSRVSLTLIDLRGLDASERESQTTALTQGQAERPFDLTAGPPHRATLFWVGDDEYVLTLTLHHIISDGWSQMVLMRELTTLYESCLSGSASHLPELAIQYVDYAVWQNSQAGGETFRSHLEYWRRQLRDLQPLSLYSDLPRPAVQNFRGATASLDIRGSTAADLKQLSRDRQVTPYMVLLAVFAVLLYRYSGQEDIVVGSPVANRSHRQLEDLIGFFVNMMVLRVRARAEMTFLDLLDEVKRVCLDSYCHEDLPLDRLIEALRPERDLSRHPLFQVTFQVLATDAYEFHLRGVSLKQAEVPSSTSKFDLTLDVHEYPDWLQPRLEYKTDLFNADTAESVLRHYANLLRSSIENPHWRLHKLHLIDDVERHRVVCEWNRTAIEWDSSELTPYAIRKQANLTPDSIALVWGDESITYRQLLSRADAFAMQLRTSGVGAEQVVGICMERSPDLVVAMLAVWFAGGAYLPLDPSLPSERLRQIVEGSAAILVIAPPELKFPILDVPIVNVSASVSAPAPLRSPKLDAANLAYVISTSGSTGPPKSVMISHGALHNHMAWMQNCFPLDGNDTVLQKTPASFDASVWEYWAPLIAGGRLVLAEPSGHADAAYLIRTVEQFAVTVLQVVPAQLEMLLNYRLDSCHSLETLFCGGGTIHPDLVQRFRQQSTANFVNLYGPTEATIDTAFWPVEDPPGQLVPIGHPVANTSLLVVDAEYEIVPAGIPGELVIGGDSLGRGYRNDAALTALKFVPNSFPSIPGTRIYRTGDICRTRRTGELEFLGRSDHQIKLAGYRFEPGEIEHTIRRSESVRDCVVDIREDTSGAKVLTAYIVSVQGDDVDSGKLRALLRKFLPYYMVPTRWVFLDTLPLTPHGKLDRKRLPVPAATNPSTESVYVPPSTEQQIVADVWATVLHMDRIGIDDNFFDIGGHSLLLTDLARRLTKALGKPVPLLDLFRYPTISAFCAFLSSRIPKRETDDGLAERVAEGQSRRDLRRRLLTESQ